MYVIETGILSSKTKIRRPCKTMWWLNIKVEHDKSTSITTPLDKNPLMYGWTKIFR